MIIGEEDENLGQEGGVEGLIHHHLLPHIQALPALHLHRPVVVETGEGKEAEIALNHLNNYVLFSIIKHK